jgi:hypothetical protein
MKLTETQIQEIDNRLKNNGIKYWDIRIEMLDHVVTDVENRLEKGEELEKAITNSFISLGWKRNLKRLNREGWQNVNDKFRREHLLEIKNLIFNIKNLMIFFSSLLLYYFLSEMLTFKVFNTVSVLIFSLPIILVLYLYVKTWHKKYGRSVNLDYGFFYLTLSFMILPAIPNFFKNQPELIQKIVWAIVLLVHFLSISSGYKVYKKTLQKVEKMRKQLLS